MIDQLSPLSAPGAGTAGPLAGPARISAPGMSRATSSAGLEATDFGTVLGKFITDTAGALKTAEAASINGVMGQASVQEVVESVLAAEQTLQAAIAIRDKVVAAYLELSRMAI